MPLSVYSYVNDYRAIKILAAARAAHVEVAVPKFNYPEDLNKPEFKAKSPFGKVPVLDTDDGAIFEPHAAVRLVTRLGDEPSLLGKSPYDQAIVDQWMDFCLNELEPARDAWMYPLQGFSEGDAALLKDAKADVFAALAHLDNHLSTRTYIAGDYATAADITLVSALIDPFRLVMVEGVRVHKFANLTRWFDTIAHQPYFLEVVGEVEFAKTEAKPKAVKAPAGGKKGGKNKNKQQQKQKQSKKKDKGGASAAAAAAPEAPKKKPVDPLTLLPKTSMVLDDVKRVFSNNPAADALKDFWQKFDAEGWSLWLSEYRYPAENTKDYMTSNLVGGFINRLESLRRWGFGVVNVVGVEDSKGPFDILGAWLVRGTELPLQMTDCPDYESHLFTKVDSTEGSESRKVWESYFLQEEDTGTLRDKPVYEKKYLK